MRTGRLFCGFLAVLGTTLLLSGGVLAVSAWGQGSQDPLPPRPEAESPAEIYGRDCAYCHAPDARGTSLAPSLQGLGPAAVDFVLRTGRMPLPSPEMRQRRREPYYTGEEIQGLVDYVSTFVSGPPVPEVEVDPAVMAKGGELYRLHCAACHQFAGTGGVLIGGARLAPTLHFSTPTEVVEAIRYGPTTMPQFSEEQISDEDARAIASFIALELQKPRDEGGIPLGHYGPFAEGFIAWVVGLAAILVAALWIGRRT